MAGSSTVEFLEACTPTFSINMAVAQAQ